MLSTGVKAGTGASGTAVLNALFYLLLWRRRNGMSSMVQPENNTSKPELDGAVSAAARMKCWRQREDSNTPVPGLPEEEEATLAESSREEMELHGREVKAEMDTNGVRGTKEA